MSILKFPLEDIIGDGMARESEFRDKLNTFDYEPFRDRAVMIPWVHHMELPIWVYLMTAARLSGVAAVLSFGEICSPITLLQRGRPLTGQTERPEG